MISFIMKSTLILSVFLLCYFGFLRNAKRFTFIRFYLLVALILSMVIPVIHFNFGYNWGLNPTIIDPVHLRNWPGHIENFNLESSVNVEAVNTNFLFSLKPLLFFLYGAGVMVMLIRLVRGFYFVYRSIRNSGIIQYQDQTIYLSELASLPFSFWRKIIVPVQYWERKKIDKYILLHERSHVISLHSLDVIFVEILLTIYWFNPLLWVFKNSIKENHEFAADQYVLNHGNNFRSYSGKLLEFVSKQKNLTLASTFYFSTIKNRITMMKKEKFNNSIFAIRFTGAAMIVGLCLVTVSCYNDLESSRSSNEDAFVVVLDAAHGGKDLGATAYSLNEKDITLALANTLKDLNTSKDIQFILTRNDDSFLSLQDRVEIANRSKADLFVSLHLNKAKDMGARGFEVYYSNDNLLAESSKEFASIFSTNVDFQNREDVSIHEGPFWVTRKAECPAVLLELGFMTNKDDIRLMQSDQGVESMASNLLSSIIKVKNKAQQQL